MTVVKTKTKVITVTNHNRSKQCDEPIKFLAITCNLLKVQKKSCLQGAIGFGFASNWLKTWCGTFKPTAKHSNHNHVITFDIWKLL